MDDDAPKPRRTPTALIVSLVSGLVVLATATVGGLLWLLTRQEPDLRPDEGPPSSPDDQADGGGGGTAEADTPSHNEAGTADGGEAGSTGSSTDGCDEDLSCDAPTCDAPSCQSETPTCESGSGVVSAGMSVMSVLPLVTVDRLGPRRPLRHRPRPSVPARCGLVAIRGYRRFVSPRTATRCRYVPSCSRYGAATIARYGLANGSRLALRRIRRCTKSVQKGTVDPPP